MLYQYVAFRRDDGQELRGIVEAASEELVEQSLWEQDCVIAILKPAESRRYKYIAFRRDDGQELRGIVEAASEELAEQTLWRQDYIVAILKPAGKLSLAGAMLASFGVKLGDLIFLCLVLAMFLGSYLIRTQGLLMAITGRSMEPNLRVGDLVLVKGVAPQDVSEGDIIVFNVSPLLQKTYSYPPVVAHRVIEVVTSGDMLAFRTKGDNSGEDPFTVLPRNLRGQPHRRIPFLGFVPLFLQSRQGVYFVVAAIILAGLWRYGEEMAQGIRGFQRALFAPIIAREAQNREELQQGQERIEQALVQLVELVMREPSPRPSRQQGLDGAAVVRRRAIAHDQQLAGRPAQQRLQETDRSTPSGGPLLHL